MRCRAAGQPLGGEVGQDACDYAWRVCALPRERLPSRGFVQALLSTAPKVKADKCQMIAAGEWCAAGERGWRARQARGGRGRAAARRVHCCSRAFAIVRTTPRPCNTRAPLPRTYTHIHAPKRSQSVANGELCGGAFGQGAANCDVALFQLVFQAAASEFCLAGAVGEENMPPLFPGVAPPAAEGRAGPAGAAAPQQARPPPAATKPGVSTVYYTGAGAAAAPRAAAAPKAGTAVYTAAGHAAKPRAAPAEPPAAAKPAAAAAGPQAAAKTAAPKAAAHAAPAKAPHVSPKVATFNHTHAAAAPRAVAAAPPKGTPATGAATATAPATAPAKP